MRLFFILNLIFNIISLVNNNDDKTKSKVPDFILEINNKFDQFLKFSKELKDEVIVTLGKEIDEISKQLEAGNEKYLKPLIEKSAEAIKYMSSQICNAADMDYESCRKDKKKMMKNLLTKLRDQFQCSKILSSIITDILSDDIEFNLKTILLLFNSLTKIPESIEKGTNMIIYDAMNCLEDRFEDYWGKILTKLNFKPKDYIYTLKFDNS